MIELRNVTKKYDNGRGVEDINFNITTGEFVFLTGESGAGKTTILKLLLGVFPPDIGEIEMDGWMVSQLPKNKIPSYRRQLGIVFQDYRLLPNKTVEENVFMPLKVAGMGWEESEASVRNALATVRMSSRNRSFPKELSGGEQQRVAIARAIVNRPNVILADEPTGNLDRKTADEIFELMRSLHKEGKTIIFATHDRSFIKRGDKEVALRGGAFENGHID